MLSVVLNGTALPSAAAGMSTGDAGMHHAGHGGAPDQGPDRLPADDFPMDCCDGGACGCGCVMPATVIAPVLPPVPYQHDVADAKFVDSLHPLSAIGAPFRPPA